MDKQKIKDLVTGKVIVKRKTILYGSILPIMVFNFLALLGTIAVIRSSEILAVIPMFIEWALVIFVNYVTLKEIREERR